jgi:hypothetical protein
MEDFPMKKLLYLVVAAGVFIILSTVALADDFELIGKEISPGIDLGDRTVGALFVGKFFDSSFSSELGRFTVILDHDGVGIEECGGRTQLLRFRLIMNFDSGARLVLLGPVDEEVDAYWDWNDPDRVAGGCPLINGADYLRYVVLFSPAPPNPVACTDGGNAFISDVPEFGVRRLWLGSYRTPFSGGSVSGHLVHTPIISPAIYGSLTLN